jgi:hypothetical protein
MKVPMHIKARLVDQNGLKPQRLVKTAPGMPDLAGETIYESEGARRNGIISSIYPHRLAIETARQ